MPPIESHPSVQSTRIGDHSISAIERRQIASNVFLIRPQWIGYVDGYACTLPMATAEAALQEAAGEVNAVLRDPAKASVSDYLCPPLARAAASTRR